MVIFFVISVSIIFIIKFLISFSTFKIDIKALELINKELKKFEIVLEFNLFNKIKWLAVKINRQKIEKMKGNKKLNVFNKILDERILKKYRTAGKLEIKNLKKLIIELNEFDIEKIKLETKIGTENVALTAILTGIISGILGVFLAKKAITHNFKIEPLYLEKNYIYLSINCIIAIKLVHIMNILKKEKECAKDERRTWNRGSYDDSNG